MKREHDFLVAICLLCCEMMPGQTVYHPLSVGDNVISPVPIPHTPVTRTLREPLRRGKVTVAFVIDEEGYVARTKVVQSTGAPDLDQMAVETVRGYTFRPATRKGIPVAVTVKTDVNVVMGEGEATPMKEKPSKPSNYINANLLVAYQPDFPEPHPKCPFQVDVEVHFIVNEEGRPTRLSIETLGPGDSFDNEALHTVSRYRFSPAKSNGVPLAVPAMVKVNFTCFK